MLAPSLAAGAELGATVANMRFIKPLDLELLARLAREHSCLVTVEEGSVMGGAGAAVAEALAPQGVVRPLLMLGLPDRFIQQGDQTALLASVGLDAHGIARAIRRRFDVTEPRLVVNRR
jgi:1-deoxy-D-xylulose-5-phosphate synthase